MDYSYRLYLDCCLIKKEKNKNCRKPHNQRREFGILRNRKNKVRPKKKTLVY